MKTELCDRFGIEYPIFVFTPSEKVAAAVTRAGGLGVLGCVRFNAADDLERVLQWMDENTDGKPYGVDIVMPAKMPTEGSSVDINKLIPQDHRDFVDKTLADLGVPPLPEDEAKSEGVLGWLHSVARSHVEVALKHPIKLIANALGSPPKDVIDQVHAAGVPVAALAGSAKHAQRHADNGVDIVIAQGHEAGGHTGEIASMVLVPEVVDAVAAQGLACRPRGRRHRVRSAGRRRAGARCSGRVDGFGVPHRRRVRPRRATAIREFGDSGGHARSDLQRHRPPPHLHRQAGATAQVDGRRPGDADGAPEPLPMPLQNILVSEAHQRMNEGTNPATVAMPVGQIVGRMNEIRPVADIIAELVSGFEDATRRLDDIRG